MKDKILSNVSQTSMYKMENWTKYETNLENMVEQSMIPYPPCLIKKTNNSKLESVIGNYNYTSIEKGLTETINWFFNNYEKARK